MTAPAPRPAALTGIDRDIAVLEARIFDRAGFARCGDVAGVSYQQAEWVVRLLHPVRREKRVEW